MKKLITLLTILVCLSCKKKPENDIKPDYQLITIFDISPELIEKDKEEVDILKNTTLVEGNSKEILLQNAFNYYSNFWQSKKDYYVKNDIQYNIDSANAIIENLKNDISVVYNQDKFAILNKPSQGIDELSDISKTDDIWILENNIWKPFLDYSAKFQKSTRIDINNDGFTDVILKGGCCDTESISIFLSDKNGDIKYTQEIGLIGNAKIELKEKCLSKIEVTFFQNEDYKETAFFNCKSNKFVLK
ncbi:hypothetical protein [Leptospira terpstrae]|uniref:Uncharacterized protein n=1 Tax=Leptospira terpstrae serovar Hualin str. LT 11-33 = ATCC 700639 TaxID=1257025 RepID=N1W796_9LEPT|nr:hypothetical protein [Leptospira terpstrae]EMY63536.1 hypothetical protein LEP1GSC203_0420 [Leptospira terpstrae serovar Hualin str. LT 11-33 = ATCC 700639]